MLNWKDTGRTRRTSTFAAVWEGGEFKIVRGSEGGPQGSRLTFKNFKSEVINIGVFKSNQDAKDAADRFMQA